MVIPWAIIFKEQENKSHALVPMVKKLVANMSDLLTTQDYSLATGTCNNTCWKVHKGDFKVRNIRMRVDILIPALVFSLIILTGCGTSQKTSANPSASATSTTSASSEVFVSGCGYGYSQKPSSITLTCGDGGMYLDQITYSAWDPTSAQGSGIYFENNCDPECASGKMIETKVSISLKNPIKDSAGKMIFSQLIMTSKTELFNGTKTASFDISAQPESNIDLSTTAEDTPIPMNPEEATNDLLSRLNSNSDLWQYNYAATSEAGRFSHQRLGLYSEPDYVIECNLSYSGTWLFVYSDENYAYEAFNSNYFFRTSVYSAQLMYDPTTNLIVILHTSMGGNRTCLNSAYEQLDYYATD